MVCPICKSLVGNDAQVCNKCGYTFYYNDDGIKVITTTNSVEGHTIELYYGIVSGEVSLGTGILSELSAGVSDFFGSTSGAFSSKLGQAKNGALTIMRNNASKLKANAIIGIDFDIILTNSNMFIVSANGTAVKIDWIDQKPQESQKPQNTDVVKSIELSEAEINDIVLKRLKGETNTELDLHLDESLFDLYRMHPNRKELMKIVFSTFENDFSVRNIAEVFEDMLPVMEIAPYIEKLISDGVIEKNEETKKFRYIK